MWPPNSAIAKCRCRRLARPCSSRSPPGETADTLASLRYCKQEGLKIGAVVNVKESTIARESDAVFPIMAGPEIGVCLDQGLSHCQLTALAARSPSVRRARAER